MSTATSKITRQEQLKANESMDSLEKLNTTEVKKSVIKIQVEGIDGVVEIPEKAFSLLKSILEKMSEGKTVSLVANESELTTQEAADILNVSRPYLVRLLNEEKLPYIKVGTHRRLVLEDVLAYDKQEKKKRRGLLNKLAEQAQDLNMGY